MALEHLLGTLTREAEAEAGAILAAARAEAEAIRAQGEAARAARRSSVQTARDTDKRAAVALAVAEARRAGRREELEARQRVLDRVFAETRTRLHSLLDAPAFLAALPGRVEEAVACLGSRPGTLRYHRALGQAIGRIAPERAGLRQVVDDDVGPGFRLNSDDGGLVVNGTLDDLLERQIPRLALAIVARLETP